MLFFFASWYGNMLQYVYVLPTFPSFGDKLLIVISKSLPFHKFTVSCFQNDIFLSMPSEIKVMMLNKGMLCANILLFHENYMIKNCMKL